MSEKKSPATRKKSTGKGKDVKKDVIQNPETPILTITPVIQEQASSASDNMPSTESVDTGPLEFGLEIRKMLSTGGTLQLTEAQSKLLYGAFEDHEIWIKPDGLIYITWSKIAERLNKAFTGTGWVMIPEGMPKIHNNIVFWGFHLVIKGVYCGFAIGEQQYFPDNGRMTYGEACEGAKSNSLMRLSKGLGIGLQIWDKEFIKRWQAAYAGSRWDNKGAKPKQIWFVKDGAFGNVKENKTEPTQTHTPPPAAPMNTNTDNTMMAGSKETAKGSHTVQKTTASEIKTEKISDQHLDGTTTPKTVLTKQEEKYAELKKSLETSISTTALANEYHFVKVAWNKGEITDAQKETLRKLANDLATKMTTNLSKK